VIQLSVVIPTWNGLRYLPACLAAIRAQLHEGDEIVLVDNGSRDHAAAWAKQYAPDVRLVILPHNRGFAGGTNAGIRAARNELLLLCNDDALLEPGCIDALRGVMQAQPPDVGMVAGVLLFSTHPHIVASSGIQMQRDGVAIDRDLHRPVTVLPDQPVEIFGASGGLVLLRRTLLDDVGLFAERFFAYLEDVDLAWRARLRGWRCLLAPAARARHVCSASGSAFKQRLLARNRWRVLLRGMPLPLLLACLPSMLCYDMLAFGYAALHQQRAIAAGRLDVLHELPLLLRERHTLQAGRTAPLAALAQWLVPPPPLRTLMINSGQV
jgi:GT2 family glycosyltransferase